MFVLNQCPTKKNKVGIQKRPINPENKLFLHLHLLNQSQELRVRRCGCGNIRVNRLQFKMG